MTEAPSPSPSSSTDNMATDALMADIDDVVGRARGDAIVASHVCGEDFDGVSAPITVDEFLRRPHAHVHLAIYANDRGLDGESVLCLMPLVSLPVVTQRIVLLFLILNTTLYEIIALSTWLPAWKQRHDINRNLACGLTLGLMAIVYGAFVALRRKHRWRILMLCLWIIVLGLGLGFLGVALATLIPILVPITLFFTYLFLLGLSGCTKDILRFVPFLGLAIMVTLGSLAIWFGPIHRTLDADIHDAGGPVAGWVAAICSSIALLLIQLSTYFSLTTLATTAHMRRSHLTPKGAEGTVTPGAISLAVDALIAIYVDPAIVLIRMFSCVCYPRSPQREGREGCLACGCWWCHPSLCSLASDSSSLESGSRFTDYNMDTMRLALMPAAAGGATSSSGNQGDGKGKGDDDDPAAKNPIAHAASQIKRPEAEYLNLDARTTAALVDRLERNRGYYALARASDTSSYIGDDVPSEVRIRIVRLAMTREEEEAEGYDDDHAKATVGGTLTGRKLIFSIDESAY